MTFQSQSILTSFKWLDWPQKTLRVKKYTIKQDRTYQLMMFFGRQWSRLFLVDAKAIFWLTYARFFGRHQARVFAKVILWIFFCSNRLGFRSTLVIVIFRLTSTKSVFCLWQLRVCSTDVGQAFSHQHQQVLLFNRRQAKKYHQPMSSKKVQVGVCQKIAPTDIRSKIVSIDVDKKN